MTMRSTRIRLLAGLSLLGLPAASAAQDAASGGEQAQTAVNCSRTATIDGSGFEAQFQAYFVIEDGFLRQKADSPAIASVSLLPGRLALGRGVTLARHDSMDEVPEYEFEPPRMDVEVTSEPGTPRKVNVSVSFDQGVEVKPVMLRVLRGSTTLATIESLGVSANADDTGNRNFRVSYEFGADDAQRWFRAPVTIELHQNGRLLARMDFDARLPSLEPFMMSQLEMLEGQPTDGQTFPEGCTLGGGCFLTTAIVTAIGLDDDCWELRTLRRFRDTLLVTGGDKARRMVTDYYAQAPLVVASVGGRLDARRIWLRAYWFGILPAALAAQMGRRGMALALYTLWTRKLSALATVS